jgi:hypothetical protein
VNVTLLLCTVYYLRDKLAREEEELKSQVADIEDKYREFLALLEDGDRQMEQMEADYKNLQEADKLLDKNFKKEFPGLGFHQLDALYKLFKKRPKVSQSAVIQNRFLCNLMPYIPDRWQSGWSRQRKSGQQAKEIRAENPDPPLGMSGHVIVINDHVCYAFSGPSALLPYCSKGFRQK